MRTFSPNTESNFSQALYSFQLITATENPLTTTAFIMDAFIKPAPKEADRKEATALWSVIKKEDSIPEELVNLVALKNHAIRAVAESRKRARDTTNDATAPKAKKPRTAAARKRKFEKWTKMLGREALKVKFMSSGWGDGDKEVVVKDTAAMDVEEFKELFGVCGKDISASAKAVVQSREYKDLAEMQELFGGKEVFSGVVETQTWKQRPFSKAFPCGKYNSNVLSLIAKHNRTKMRLELKFLVEEPDETCF